MPMREEKEKSFRKKTMVKTKTGMKPSLTEEDKIGIVAKRRAGKSTDDLAREYGRSVYTIRTVLREFRANTPKGVPPRLLTAEERAKIEKLSESRTPVEEIVKEVGRGINVVNQAIRDYHKRIVREYIQGQRAGIASLIDRGLSTKQVADLVGEELREVLKEHREAERQ